ncbi:hypothetical protein ACFE04_000065 [Oxalis oulophora]
MWQPAIIEGENATSVLLRGEKGDVLLVKFLSANGRTGRTLGPAGSMLVVLSKRKIFFICKDHLVSVQGKRDLCEPLELQLDYWLTSKSNEVKNDVGGKKNDSGKLTLKTAFRSLQIAKLNFGEAPVAQFSINYTTKEKKQKIMRLGKKKEKDKENEHKCQLVDGVCRLICSPRAQNIPLSGTSTLYQFVGGREISPLCSKLLLYLKFQYRWKRVDWREIFPAIVSMADPYSKFSYYVVQRPARLYFKLICVSVLRLEVVVNN